MDAPRPAPLADAPPRVKRAIIAATAAIAISGTVGFALLPSLSVRHPRVLLLLAPNYLGLVAPRVEFLDAYLIVSMRRLFGMCATWGFGGLYGAATLHRATAGSARAERALAWLQRHFPRWGALLIVLNPGLWVSLVAGVVAMPLRSFALAALLGQLIWTAVYYRFSLAIGALTGRVVGFLETHLFETSALFLALVVAQQVVSRVRRKAVPPKG